MKLTLSILTYMIGWSLIVAGVLLLALLISSAIVAFIKLSIFGGNAIYQNIIQ